MPSRRLALAFAASLLLHAAALGGGAWLAAPPRAKPAATPAMLDATLLPPKTPAEPLLKDTLAEAEPAPRLAPRPAAERTGPRRPEAAARRKLAEHVFYPAEAVARGIEGEVRLLLILAEDGSVLDAQVASSSGHSLLDQAALRAAYAMGRLAGAGRRELILPVEFRLH